MGSVAACEIPEGALLAAYRGAGGHADAYATQVDDTIALEAYVRAFYTTWLFKLERAILTLASHPSSDAEAARLAAGALDRFAAWTVEGRRESEILLRDVTGRTRSWLKVEPMDDGAGTRLYFGSAVVPRARPGDERPTLRLPFALLLDFHRAYSVALLHAARARLVRVRPTPA